jgi:hypothetical protein
MKYKHERSELIGIIKGLTERVIALEEENTRNICVKYIKADGTFVLDTREPLPKDAVQNSVEPAHPWPRTATEQEWEVKLLEILINLQKRGIIKKVVK